MKLYCWTAADYEAADVLTVDNASVVSAMELTATENKYVGIVEGIAAKDLDKTIYVAGVYEADGVTYCTGVLAYHVGQYCKTTANGSTEAADLAAATATYGYYAKLYFASIA